MAHVLRSGGLTDASGKQAVGLTLQVFDTATCKLACLVSSAQLEARFPNKDKALIWLKDYNKDNAAEENVTVFKQSLPAASTVEYLSPGQSSNPTALVITRRSDGARREIEGTWCLKMECATVEELEAIVRSLFDNYMGVGGQVVANRFRHPFAGAKHLIFRNVLEGRQPWNTNFTITVRWLGLVTSAGEQFVRNVSGSYPWVLWCGRFAVASTTEFSSLFPCAQASVDDALKAIDDSEQQLADATSTPAAQRTGTPPTSPAARPRTQPPPASPSGANAAAGLFASSPPVPPHVPAFPPSPSAPPLASPPPPPRNSAAGVAALATSSVAAPSDAFPDASAATSCVLQAVCAEMLRVTQVTEKHYEEKKKALLSQEAWSALLEYETEYKAWQIACAAMPALCDMQADTEPDRPAKLAANLRQILGPIAAPGQADTSRVLRCVSILEGKAKPIDHSAGILRLLNVINEQVREVLQAKKEGFIQNSDWAALITLQRAVDEHTNMSEDIPSKDNFALQMANADARADALQDLFGLAALLAQLVDHDFASPLSELQDLLVSSGMDGPVTEDSAKRRRLQ